MRERERERERERTNGSPEPRRRRERDKERVSVRWVAGQNGCEVSQTQGEISHFLGNTEYHPLICVVIETEFKRDTNYL